MQAKEVMNAYLPDKEAFYELLVRRRYYLPHIKSSIVTIKFMDGVFRKTIFCAMFDQVHPIRLASPPPRKELQNELVRVMMTLQPEPPGIALIAEL